MCGSWHLGTLSSKLKLIFELNKLVIVCLSFCFFPLFFRMPYGSIVITSTPHHIIIALLYFFRHSFSVMSKLSVTSTAKWKVGD